MCFVDRNTPNVTATLSSRDSQEISRIISMTVYSQRVFLQQQFEFQTKSIVFTKLLVYTLQEYKTGHCNGPKNSSMNKTTPQGKRLAVQITFLEYFLKRKKVKGNRVIITSE